MSKIVQLILLSILITSCKKQIHDIPPNVGQSMEERIRTFINECEEEGFSGSVLVQVKDSVLIQEGYGKSNRKDNIENTISTIFDIGSVTKQFTAAAILKLKMEGLIEISNPIGEYISELNAEKSAITIHQLLTHTSGLKESVGQDEDQISESDFINSVNSENLKHDPGEKYLYSNLGYSLLGILIEKVSAISYEEYLREKLFIPANMMNTGYIIPNWENQSLAIGYSNDNVYGSPVDQNWNDEGPSWHLKANGGVLTNLEEMYSWHLALLGNDILNDEAKSIMYDKHTIEFDSTSYYGYGWAIFPTNRGTSLITHNGSNDYFFADFLRFLDEDIVILILSNDYNIYAEEMSTQLSKIIFE